MTLLVVIGGVLLLYPLEGKSPEPFKLPMYVSRTELRTLYQKREMSFQPEANSSHELEPELIFRTIRTCLINTASLTDAKRLFTEEMSDYGHRYRYMSDSYTVGASFVIDFKIMDGDSNETWDSEINDEHVMTYILNKGEFKMQITVFRF